MTANRMATILEWFHSCLSAAISLAVHYHCLCSEYSVVIYAIPSSPVFHVWNLSDFVMISKYVQRIAFENNKVYAIQGSSNVEYCALLPGCSVCQKFIYLHNHL